MGELIRLGEVTRTTLVWTEGMSEWAAAETTLLNSLFSNTPAPVRQSELIASSFPQPNSIGAALSEEADSAPVAFRDPRPLAKFVAVLLVAFLLWRLVTIWSSFLQLDLLSGALRGQPILPAAAKSNDNREHVVALVRLGLFIFTAAVFGRWIYVVARNIRPLGAQRLQFTPGWAVGYYFIPIANLWKPYQAMKEIWKASHAPTEWQFEGGSFILVAWWTLWVISCLIGQMVFRATASAKTIQDYIDATTFSLAEDIIDIPLCLIALALVLKLSRRQFVTFTKTPNQATQLAAAR